MKNPIFLSTLIGLISLLPASAVIVAGGSGGGNNTNNTTGAQLESELSTVFPIYDNVVQYSDASGVYLGYDAVTRDVWVLTARHINASTAPITIGGQSYNFGAEFLPGGDLRLVRYSRTDGAVPSLPAVSLATTVPAASTSLVTIGYGQDRLQNGATSANSPDSTSITVTAGMVQGYNWDAPQTKRWGTNNIEAEFLNALEVPPAPVTGTTGTFSINGVDSIGFMTDFDQPGANQWLSSNESQGSLGDSGGGAFYLSGGQWVLGRNLFSSGRL
ncbi:MAG: hypothetical protein HC845_09595 [Akkermansiaceae bacterium]|nr:hypothetical protein [Akkermansiaceae bacterium]